MSRRLYTLTAFTCLLLLSMKSSLAFSTHSNVAGYAPFSQLLDKNDIIGLLWTVDSQIYTSRCFSALGQCTGERGLFNHSVTITDMEIYFEKKGLYFSDAIGQLHWLDLSVDWSTALHLQSNLFVTEVSVDWLSNQLYVFTNRSQLYKCDATLKNCLPIHYLPLPYTPRSLVADPYNGFLYWLDSRGAMVRLDLAKSDSDADAVIPSNVVTYSVSFNFYDLYSIYKYNETHSEITLTYLNGQNEQMHIPLNHSATTAYSHLNCFHGSYCLWLESKNTTTDLLWYQKITKQNLTVSSIDNLTLTSSSILKQWHQQVQPIPVPAASPSFADVYADSNSVEAIWEKPNILAHLVKTAQNLNFLWNRNTDIYKFMQSEAAWSNWTYELNISNPDDSYKFVISGIHLPLEYRFTDLNSSTEYRLSLVAYNDIKRSPSRTVVVRTLSTDPVIYTSDGFSISSMDVFGRNQKTLMLATLGFNRLICELEVGGSNSLYVITVFSLALKCSRRQNPALLVLDLSTAGSLNVTSQIPDVTSVAYDWIGKKVYMVEREERIYRQDVNDNISPRVALTSTLPYDVKDIAVDSSNAVMYWASRISIYRCSFGPFRKCDESRPVYSLPKYSVLAGPVVDIFTNTLRWIKLNATGIEVFNLDLTTQIPGPSTSLKNLNSSQPMVVADDKLYTVAEQLLACIDLQTNSTATYPGVVASLLAYNSSKSFPSLPGVNSTGEVKPQVDVHSIQVFGTYDNFSISWSLANNLPPTVAVYYTVTVRSAINSSTYYENMNLSTHSTPLLRNVSAQSALLLSIQPHTSYHSGDNITLDLESPAAVPGDCTNLRVYSMLKEVEIYVVVKWDPPAFTGGTITSYEVKLITQDGKETDYLFDDPDGIVPIEAGVLYNISVRAETKAGYGGWSEVLLYSTSTSAFHVPFITVHPYTPEKIEVHWQSASSTLRNSYNFSIFYSLSGEDDSVTSQAANYLVGFETIKALQPDTEYIIKMMVCSISTNKTLWLGGEQCVFSNVVTTTSYIKPQGVMVESVSFNKILVNWTSPIRAEVEKHHIRYKPLNSDGVYLKTPIETTKPGSIYKETLGNLQSNTEYEITLVLSYERYADYMVPLADEMKLIVKTNMTLPGPVTVLSLECGTKMCDIKTGDSQYDIHVQIVCNNNFEITVDNINPNDFTQIPRPSEFPTDITTCSATAWSVNSVGKGPVSDPVGLVEKPQGDSGFTTILSATITAVLIVMVIAAVFYFYVRKNRKKKKQGRVRYDAQMVSVDVSLYGTTERERAKTPPFSPQGQEFSLPYTLTNNSLYGTEGLAELRHSVSDEMSMLQYDRQKLLLTKFLGSGAFGEVYEGKARDIVTADVTTLVAVKTLRPDASLPYKEEFVKEARLMSQFDNEYIVKLLGVCIDRDPYYILIELMNQGDLVAFLRRSRPNKYRAGTLNLGELLSVCIDVASGCAYLEKLHFVHRDLAARNCLVNQDTEESKYRVKIGDFGLARDIYRNDYYRKEGEALLPVRWMSPEALVDGVFTTQSDIWAFGVLMWEVFTLAMQPYPARSNIEVLQFVTNSGTLDRPIRCPELLFKTMSECWNYEPSGRPTFKEILRRLQLFESVHLTPRILRIYDHSNRKVTSESEFFAGSTSSGGSILPAPSESPVFSHENVSTIKDEEVIEPPQCEFDSVWSQPPPKLTPFQSIKNLFRKRGPSHLLDRANSTPISSNKRKKNKYIRSKSTISADGVNSTKTFTQADGAKLSVNTHGCKDSENSFNVDLSTSNHNLASSRGPGPRLRSISLPPVQYSTMAFDNPSNSSIPPVQYSTMAFGNSPNSSIPPVQYSTMAFGNPPNGAKDSEQDSVQYTTVAFSQPVATKPSTSQENETVSGNTPSAQDTVQYSAIVFNPDADALKQQEEPKQPNVRTTAEAESKLKEKKDVQYTTEVFSDETQASSNTPTDQQPSSINESDEKTVDYATMAYNPESQMSSEDKNAESDFDEPKMSSVQNTAASLGSLNSLDRLGVSTGSASPSLHSSRQTLSTHSPSLTGSIERTPFGAKVTYTSEKFKHSPSSSRSNLLQIGEDSTSGISNSYTKTL